MRSAVKVLSSLDCTLIELRSYLTCISIVHDYCQKLLNLLAKNAISICISANYDLSPSTINYFLTT